PSPRSSRVSPTVAFVGALDSRLDVRTVRLAGCLRAPPRSWTLLLALAGFLRPSPSLAPSTAGSTYGQYASPAAFGRRLAAGPFSSLDPVFSDRLLARTATARRCWSTSGCRW